LNAHDYNKAVEMYADGIFRFALKHLRNEMSAKDIVQTTFMKVWDKHSEIEASKVKSYLFTTAYHAIVDWVKQEKRSADFELIPQQAAPLSAEFDLSATLEWALNKLPEIQKSVVLLRDYEGYSYDEIAEITNLTESQVKVYIFRARQSLKNILKERELVA
jgi:RNA polymerase sigma factor (sigma-70 family)